MNAPSAITTTGKKPPLRHHLGLEIIALWKLLKGAVLLAVAIGLLRLLHTDLTDTLEHWVTFFGGDPDNKYLHSLLVKVAGLNPRELKTISAGSFFYSALMFVEGVGLWFEWRWAEYLTLIATGSLIPVELYELSLGFTVTKFAVLLLNLSILLYLAWFLDRHRRNATPVAPAPLVAAKDG